MCRDLIYICFVYLYILLTFTFSGLSLSLSLSLSHTHTHTHMYICICMYIYIYTYKVRPVWLILPNYVNTVILRNACFHNMCCVLANGCRNNSVRTISDRDMSEKSVSFLTPDTRRNSCQDGSVGIVTRYGLNDREIVILFPAGTEDFSFL